MNRFVAAVTSLDVATVRDLLKTQVWSDWSEPSGKNALHYLCAVTPKDSDETERSLRMLKLLLESGLAINSIHRIEDKNCDFFPATPLWYAYTRGRNEKLYSYLLKNGADTRYCWWAIAWYDDVKAGELWLKHGAVIDQKPTLDELFLGTFQWKKYAFARWLLQHGADVNARGPGGMTALMLAVKRKDEDAIKWLVAAGADPDSEDEQGMSARRIAQVKGPRRIGNLF